MSKASKIHLTREELDEIFVIKGGELYWKQRGCGRQLDRPAGFTRSNGYRLIHVDGKFYLRHRLIYFMVHGEQPLLIDHIDGTPGNDHPDNLRAADYSRNNWNQRKTSLNTSGYVGVSYYKGIGAYAARIRRFGKLHFLGYYDTPEEAAIAYQRAKKVLHEGFVNVDERVLTVADIPKRPAARKRYNKDNRILDTITKGELV